MRPSSLFSRAAVASIACASALAFAPAADAVSLSNLSVNFDPGNTPNLFQDVGPIGAQISSTVGVLSSSGTQFVTRYQAGVYTDTGGSGAATNVITLNASYTISFDVTDAAGSAWQLDIDTSRIGARTSVTDGGGQSAFSLSAATGLLGGAGTISSGSLGLAAIGRTQQGTSVNLAFNQAGNAIVDGTGNGSVTLNFSFSATAETILGGGAGDEAAVRMGIPENLSSYTAGAYPGAGSRTAANDGHFVNLTLLDLGPIPEPDTALMLGIGLVMLAGWRRRETRRS
jgi:hypothetical protein